jgi:hypothetical protein
MPVEQSSALRASMAAIAYVRQMGVGLRCVFARCSSLALPYRAVPAALRHGLGRRRHVYGRRRVVRQPIERALLLVNIGVRPSAEGLPACSAFFTGEPVIAAGEAGDSKAQKHNPGHCIPLFIAGPCCRIHVVEVPCADSHASRSPTFLNWL